MSSFIPPTDAEPAPPRTPLLPERSDFLEGDSPAAAKVEAFLAQALEATGTDAPTTAGAMVPWICDALLSNNSVKGRCLHHLRQIRSLQSLRHAIPSVWPGDGILKMIAVLSK